MARVGPFVGTRFDATVVGDLGAVTAPPYDAIGHDEQAALYAASPYNVIRLELARPEPDDAPYRAARRHLHAWRADGVLIDDPEPALYPYEQTGVGPTGAAFHQRGVVAQIEVADWHEAVLPHERVYDAAMQDRLALLSAIETNTSPVFVLAEHGADETAALFARCPADALIDLIDGAGIRHRMWRVTDHDVVSGFVSAMAPQRLLMADGHHRYTAAQHALASGLAGADDIMAFIVPIAHGPTIHPMHRLMLHPETPTSLDGWRRALASLPVVVSPVAAPTDDTAAAALLERSPGTLGVIVTRDGSAALEVDPGALQAALAPLARASGRLSQRDLEAPLATTEAALLQSLLHDGLGIPVGIDHVLHTSDAASAIAQVASARAASLVLTRAVPLSDVAAVADAGQRLPQKTTAFQPKPRTGLVLRALRQRWTQPHGR